MIMKNIILLPLFSVLATSVQTPEEILVKMSKVHDACVQRLGISEDVIAKYRITDSSPPVMCYVDCLMTTSGWMKDGKIQRESTIESFDPARRNYAVKVLDSCENVEVGTHPCEHSYNFHLCAYRTDPENYYLA
ncbi:pheromone binding protein [Rhyzopertha dominica]|nr:pheromone binding protein [Rhyzopertha dominica]